VLPSYNKQAPAKRKVKNPPEAGRIFYLKLGRFKRHPGYGIILEILDGTDHSKNNARFEAEEEK
jgi:hypothetical protein